MSDASHKPLVRCPRCESGLIYAVECEAVGPSVVLRRRCPECEHRDSVETTWFAVRVWRRREARISGELRAYADALACGDGPELERARLER